MHTRTPVLSLHCTLNNARFLQRLAKWFTTLSPKDKAKIIKDVSQLVLARRARMCNFLEYKGSSIPLRLLRMPHLHAGMLYLPGC